MGGRTMYNSKIASSPATADIVQVPSLTSSLVVDSTTSGCTELSTEVAVLPPFVG